MRIGAVGFCFGGAMAWNLIQAGEPRRAEAALKAVGLAHEIRTFAGADHAFSNDTGARCNAPAAQQAWAALLAWFNRHLTEPRKGRRRPCRGVAAGSLGACLPRCPPLSPSSTSTARATSTSAS
ncbi:MAG: dienelactone hydrolase family protein [Acidimicrobiales bacterium]